MSGADPDGVRVLGDSVFACDRSCECARCYGCVTDLTLSTEGVRGEWSDVSYHMCHSIEKPLVTHDSQ